MKLEVCIIITIVPKMSLVVTYSVVTLAAHTCIQTHIVYSGGVFQSSGVRTAM